MLEYFFKKVKNIVAITLHATLHITNNKLIKWLVKIRE